MNYKKEVEQQIQKVKYLIECLSDDRFHIYYGTEHGSMEIDKRRITKWVHKDLFWKLNELYGEITAIEYLINQTMGE